MDRSVIIMFLSMIGVNAAATVFGTLLFLLFRDKSILKTLGIVGGIALVIYVLVSINLPWIVVLFMTGVGFVEASLVGGLVAIMMWLTLFLMRRRMRKMRY